MHTHSILIHELKLLETTQYVVKIFKKKLDHGSVQYRVDHQAVVKKQGLIQNLSLVKFCSKELIKQHVVFQLTVSLSNLWGS